MLLRKILFPIAILNFLFQLTRSFLYSANFLKVHETKINTICIGNLSMGGTGKTPLVKFLIERFPKKINMAMQISLKARAIQCLARFGIFRNYMRMP